MDMGVPLSAGLNRLVLLSLRSTAGRKAISIVLADPSLRNRMNPSPLDLGVNPGWESTVGRGAAAGGSQSKRPPAPGRTFSQAMNQAGQSSTLQQQISNMPSSKRSRESQHVASGASLLAILQHSLVLMSWLRISAEASGSRHADGADWNEDEEEKRRRRSEDAGSAATKSAHIAARHPTQKRPEAIPPSLAHRQQQRGDVPHTGTEAAPQSVNIKGKGKGKAQPPPDVADNVFEDNLAAEKKAATTGKKGKGRASTAASAKGKGRATKARKQPKEIETIEIGSDSDDEIEDPDEDRPPPPPPASASKYFPKADLRPDPSSDDPLTIRPFNLTDTKEVKEGKVKQMAGEYNAKVKVVASMKPRVRVSVCEAPLSLN